MKYILVFDFNDYGSGIDYMEFDTQEDLDKEVRLLYLNSDIEILLAAKLSEEYKYTSVLGIINTMKIPCRVYSTKLMT